MGNAATWAKGKLVDRPRDARGRFVSLGGGEARDASARADKVGTVDAHREAGKAHLQAAAKHLAEARRLEGKAAGARSKRERAVYTEAAEKMRAASAEHRGQAVEHAGKAPTLERLGIDHQLDAESKATVEAAVAKGGYAPYLAEHPIGSVREHSYEERQCNGVYARPKDKGGEAFISVMDAAAAEVKYARAVKTGPRTLGHEGTWSVSQLAKSPEEMRQRTMVHELGHHVHLDRSNPLAGEHMEAIAKAYGARVGEDKKVKEGRWCPSAYSQGDHKEWFAEVHAAYVFHPKELKAKDGEAYALVKRVRRARGMSA